ncbi:cupredoxin domain-containing protein [Lichenifustis flavocetrariae]|uniref:Cupredoxin family copper-binding protein n=1 Tax=Lichenifustis flavocetrariae TaxID=2949735 RepID=A0AA42CJK3_9HYPH|nr:cupredoxin family copper-binding protein [Lichenifustis flavocetrariae]MCW6508176.1 cupredoxin family copper-binding protein [Lichenifustis flavocetrariae]
MLPPLHRRPRRSMLLLGLLFVGAAATPLQAAETALVTIDNFVFKPDRLVVKPGTVVTFRNDDDIPHLVVATDHSFRSPALDTGGTYQITVTKAGDLAYFCGLHPHMQGMITVSP